MRVEPCASCGAEMIWVVNKATGKRIPLDAKPVWRYRMVVQQGPVPEVAHEKVYQSHFETCPDAAYWSGRRRSAPAGGPGSPGRAPTAPTPGSPSGTEPDRAPAAD